MNPNYERAIKYLLSASLMINIIMLVKVPFVSAQQKTFPVPQIELNPEQYMCYRASDPLEIDGEFDEDDWQKAIRTKYFVDIEGELKPRPRFWTYVKMLWDDDYLYIAAELQEPHIWATIEERDAVIFEDNDFQVFIDPDGDTHMYYELEINAFDVFWDLFLVKPYRDGGPAISSWDIYGIKTGVSINGTINDPSDIDSRWRVELAIPWTVLAEATSMETPPLNGDFWRINFSRVVWPLEPKGGKYEKFKNRSTGKPAAPLNWVWSPQGLVNMHYPEMWGYVHFTETVVGEGVVQFELPPSEKIKWILRQVYYEQKNYFAKHKTYTSKLSDLELNNLEINQIKLESTINLFETTMIDSTTGTRWHLRQDGLIWNSKNDSTEEDN
jgi:hypothetical protein